MKKISRDIWIIIFIGIADLVAGLAFIWWTVDTQDMQMRNQLTTDAKLVGNSIDWRDISYLTASLADTSSPPYQRLKEQLTLVRSANPLCRFIYLLGQKPDGRIFFYLDSEPPDSIENYSPPGQIYSEASPGVLNVFKLGKEVTEGPIPDRWGTWVSAMVPLTDPNTGKIIAVLGMDIDAHTWKWQLLSATQVPIGILLLIILTEVVFLILRHRSRRENQRLAASQKKLTENETRLEAILQSTADGILAIGHDGKVLLANNRFLELWRIPDELLETGMDQALLNYVVNQLKDPEEFLNRIRSLYGTMTVDLNTLYFKDGRTFERYSCPLKQQDESVGRVWSFRDITVRKQVETELLAAKSKAEESDRLKSTFLANMSHEIRTPMNAIVGFAGMLTDPSLSQEDHVLFTSYIQSRSDDLMHIISDLLEISRIESGNATVVKEKICVNKVLDELETVFTQRLKKTNKLNLTITTEKVLADVQSTILTDGFIIKQVFSNLIDNAIKYTESGSIRAGYYQPAEGKIKFFVSDTGIGISAEQHSVIFEHFRQAEISDRYRYGGTGLGLSICKGSIALLGGEIWVESEPGKGSNFFFTIPYEAAPEETGSAGKISIEPKKHSHYDWSGKKLLLVEDEKTNMEFLQVILRPTHAVSVTVFSGSELKALYDKLDTFDLVLLDVRLPDASGWELAREMKSIRPDLPIIAQTAYAMSTDRHRSEEAGCDDFISKPIKREDLLAMMGHYL